MLYNNNLFLNVYLSFTYGCVMVIQTVIKYMIVESSMQSSGSLEIGMYGSVKIIDSMYTSRDRPFVSIEILVT